MPILQATGSFTGFADIVPNMVFINTNDTPATVTTAGYLTHAVNEGLLTVKNSDLALVSTLTAGVVSVLWLQVSITGLPGNFVYSLTTPVNSGGAVFLGNVTAGSTSVPGGFISYAGTATGSTLTLRASASAAAADTTTITNASMGQATTFTIPDPGATTANFILSKNAGVQHITAGGLQVDAGGVTAGSNGTAGALTSFPAGANLGSLIIQASNSAGAFTTTITNASQAAARIYTVPDAGASSSFLMTNSGGTQTIATGSLALTVGSVTATAGNFIAGNSAAPAAGNFQSFPAASGGANDKLVLAAVTTGGNFTSTLSNGTQGQTTVFTLPDPANATARVLVGATATPFTANHSLVASGTGGLIADAGYQMKVVAQAVVAGGAAAQTVADAFCTSASNVICTWNDTTNAVSIQKAVAGNGSFVVTSSGDPGASHLNYIITKV